MDLTKFFSDSFSKYDNLAGGNIQKSQGTQILDVNMLGVNQNTPQQTQVWKKPEDMYEKSYKESLYPEKQGWKAYQNKKQTEDVYNNILKSITEDEYNNLKYFIKNGGYVVISPEILKSMGERGEDPGLMRLEEWGLVKRDKIDSETIQITIKSMGKKVVSDIEKILGT